MTNGSAMPALCAGIGMLAHKPETVYYMAHTRKK